MLYALWSVLIVSVQKQFDEQILLIALTRDLLTSAKHKTTTWERKTEVSYLMKKNNFSCLFQEFNAAFLDVYLKSKQVLRIIIFFRPSTLANDVILSNNININIHTTLFKTQSYK